jgi:hypothetical protein
VPGLFSKTCRRRPRAHRARPPVYCWTSAAPRECATAADILALAERMAALVQRRHGVRLEREVRYLANKT